MNVDLGDDDFDIVPELPRLLRSRCCAVGNPWVDPDDPYDHGHTDCLFMGSAADRIEALEAEVSHLEYMLDDARWEAMGEDL